MDLFGTDGIRGNSSQYPFDDQTLVIIGRAIAEELRGKKNEILIISDTRESAQRISRRLAEGIVSFGKNVVFGGVLPTPAASFLVKKTGRFEAAIVISASHNPYTDNGIKIFASDGFKLKDSIEERIEKKIKYYEDLKDFKSYCAANGKPIVKIKLKQDLSLLKLYEDFISSTFDNHSLKGKTIALDCANGASYKCAPAVLKKLGAKTISLNTKPNGKNINANCGALYPQKLSEIVKKRKAFCGLAFDGDADRLIFIDEKGIVKDGDYFLSAMALFLKEKHLLKNNILTATVMANLGLLSAMKEAGIKVITSKVGDRYVLEDMLKFKSSLGGEQSGHFIFSDLLGTGDGLLSALQALKAMLIKNQNPSEFFSKIIKYPQILLNEEVKEKIPLEKLGKSAKLIKKYENILKSDGRILVRYSGTEKILRVMIEGKDENQIKEIAQELLVSIKGEIDDKVGSKH